METGTVQVALANPLQAQAEFQVPLLGQVGEAPLWIL